MHAPTKIFLTAHSTSIITIRPTLLSLRQTPFTPSSFFRHFSFSDDPFCFSYTFSKTNLWRSDDFLEILMYRRPLVMISQRLAVANSHSSATSTGIATLFSTQRFTTPFSLTIRHSADNKYLLSTSQCTTANATAPRWPVSHCCISYVFSANIVVSPMGSSHHSFFLLSSAFCRSHFQPLGNMPLVTSILSSRRSVAKLWRHSTIFLNHSSSDRLQGQ